jgi:hypothetical protein
MKAFDTSFCTDQMAPPKCSELEMIPGLVDVVYDLFLCKDNNAMP